MIELKRDRIAVSTCTAARSRRRPPSAPEPSRRRTARRERSTAAKPRRHRPSLRAAAHAAAAFSSSWSDQPWFWLRGGRYASTDDAYVQAAKLLVTPDVSGLVTTVNVHEGQAVKAGDLLFQLDPLPFQIALDNARANLHETALTIELMKADYKVMLSNVAAQQAQVAARPGDL